MFAWCNIHYIVSEPGPGPRRLSSKLLRHGYIVERLKSSLRKLYGRNGDLITQYVVSLSRMLNDIADGFYATFATGVTCQHGTLSFPDTWFSPFLGLAYAPIVKIRFSEIALSFPDFSLGIPSVLSWFCFKNVFQKESLIRFSMVIKSTN